MKAHHFIATAAASIAGALGLAWLWRKFSAPATPKPSQGQNIGAKGTGVPGGNQPGGSGTSTDVANYAIAADAGAGAFGKLIDAGQKLFGGDGDSVPDETPTTDGTEPNFGDGTGTGIVGPGGVQMQGDYFYSADYT